MNIKRTSFLLLIILQAIVCVACDNESRINLEGDNNKQVEDSTVELHLINHYVTGGSEFFKTVNKYPIDVFLHKDKLYLLNDFDNQLVIVDTYGKNTITNIKINDFIGGASDSYFGARQIVVNDDYIFIGFLRAVCCLTKEGVLVSKVICDENIDFFTVDDNKSIVVFFANSIKNYDLKGKQIGSREHNDKLTGHYYRDGNSVFVADGNLIYTYDLSSGELSKSAVPISDTPFGDLYFSFGFKAHTFWYPYMSRGQLIVFDKASNKFVKTVRFSENIFEPTDEEIQQEEGVPNFNMIPDNMGGIYIVALRGNTLEVYKSDSLVL